MNLQDFNKAIQNIDIQDLDNSTASEIITKDEHEKNSRLYYEYKQRKEELEKIKFDELESKKEKCEQILKVLNKRDKVYNHRPYVLMEAACDGDLDLVKKLVKEKVHIFDTTVQQAIYPHKWYQNQNGQFSYETQFLILVELINAGADVSRFNFIHETCKQYRCNYYSHPDEDQFGEYICQVLELLLVNGSDPNMLYESGICRTALSEILDNHYSYTRKSLARYNIVRLLIEFGANVRFDKEISYHYGSSTTSPLAFILHGDRDVLYDDLYIIDLLIKKGAGIKIDNPLTKLISNCRLYCDVVGCSLNTCERCSVYLNKLCDVVKALLEAGADPNEREDGDLIYTIASKSYSLIDVFKVLLNAGLKVNKNKCYSMDGPIHPLQYVYDRKHAYMMIHIFRICDHSCVWNGLLKATKYIIDNIEQLPVKERIKYHEFLMFVGQSKIDIPNKKMLYDTVVDDVRSIMNSKKLPNELVEKLIDYAYKK
jgi:hypothetical protein